MIALTAFEQSIAPYARAVAVPTMHRAIRDAICEMCEKTHVWRHAEDYTVSAGEDLALTTPEGSVLLAVENTSYNGGEPLTRKTVAELDLDYPGWRDNDNPGASRYVTQTSMNTLRLVPSEDGDATVSMWLKPSQDCTEVPDFFAAQYRETIAHGALARILAIPGQPYTDMNMASANAGIFAGRLQGMKNIGILGQQRATARVKGHHY